MACAPKRIMFVGRCPRFSSGAATAIFMSTVSAPQGAAHNGLGFGRTVSEFAMPRFRIVLAALGLAAMAPPALAQSDPAATPTPPKRPLVNAQAPAAAQSPGNLPAAARRSSSPVGNRLRSDTHTVNPRAISAADKAILDQVDGYFNAIRVMSGKFVQIGPDGQRTTGSFWVSKPGKMRFDCRSAVAVAGAGRWDVGRRAQSQARHADLYFIGRGAPAALPACRSHRPHPGFAQVIALGREQSGHQCGSRGAASVGDSAQHPAELSRSELHFADSGSSPIRAGL